MKRVEEQSLKVIEVPCDKKLKSSSSSSSGVFTIVENNENRFSYWYDRYEPFMDVLERIYKHRRLDFIYGSLCFGDNRVQQKDYNKLCIELFPHCEYVELIYKVAVALNPRFCEWKDYVESTSITRFQTGLSWKKSLTINFKPVLPFDKRWQIPCKKLANAPFSANEFQNSWQQPNARLYFKSVNYSRKGNIVLVKLYSEIEISFESIERIRYNVFSNKNLYCGGEFDSWKAYCDEFCCPIDTLVLDDEETIVVLPKIVLQPNTWYAYILLNTPIRWEGPPIYDDYLIPFKTNGIKPCQRAMIAFLCYMRTLGFYMYSVGKLVCRYYVFPTKFEKDTWGRIYE